MDATPPPSDAPMRRRSPHAHVWAMAVVGLAFASPASAEDEAAVILDTPEPVEVLNLNTEWDVLPEPKESDYRATLAAAAKHFAPGQTVEIASATLDGEILEALAKTPRDEHLLAVARDKLRVAVDLLDLCYFLDDVIAAEAQARGEVVLTPSRARGIGVLIHPAEVFKGRARPYGMFPVVPITAPIEAEWEPPPDGAQLGPSWHARFPNPEEEGAMFAALKDKRPASDFPDRVASLVRQLRAQGAQVAVESTLRQRERGYLMYGAFWLSKAKNSRQVRARARSLEKLKKHWKLDVDIRWMHNKGWRETKAQAVQMVEAYNVVYATRNGALKSNHYDGEAVDFVATGLPRELVLVSPAGETAFFDLSDPEETLDLSLTPEVIRWIETHFKLEKLEGDYPHWNDADREE